MDELALRYEYLIRLAHQVGRLGIPAAHADSYRGLERNFVNQRDNANPESANDLLFKYAFMCGEIVTNLMNAMWAFEREFENQFSDEDRVELDAIEHLLIYAKMEQIDESIERLEFVFRRHGRIM